jgi:hypothetical protein
MVMSLAIVFTFLAKASFFFLVECDGVWEHVGVLRLTARAIAPADIRVRHALVELVVGVGFCLVAQPSYVEVSRRIEVMKRNTKLHSQNSLVVNDHDQNSTEKEAKDVQWHLIPVVRSIWPNADSPK